MTCKGICLRHKAHKPVGSGRYAAGQQQEPAHHPKVKMDVSVKLEVEEFAAIKSKYSEVVENQGRSDQSKMRWGKMKPAARGKGAPLDSR